MIPSPAQHAADKARANRLLVAGAKQRVNKWLTTIRADAISRKKMMRGVEKIAAEVYRRSAGCEVRSVGLDRAGRVKTRVEGDHFRAVPIGRELVVVTILPDWGQGWHNIGIEAAAADDLSWFMHYAQQYVHRAHVARVLMSVWDRHQIVLHPFGSQSRSLRFTDESPAPDRSPTALLDLAVGAWASGAVVRTWPNNPSPWVRANTLDPDIHEGIAHFLRGVTLHRKQCVVEAVVAWDCTLQALERYFDRRYRGQKALTRRELCERLALPSEAVQLAEYMHVLRNNFGAHPGGWRWWDSGELLEDEILDEMQELSATALGVVAAQEPTERRIASAPDDWSEWLLVHFSTVWDSVWFDRLQQEAHRRSKV